MSFLARFLQLIRRPTSFVGKDLEGNFFYEYPGTSNDPRRTRRMVKYRKGRDMLHYATGQTNLAVQWKSWLTHTRTNPPTIEELQSDAERQQRVLHNVAILEARDQEERRRIVLERQQALPATPPGSINSDIKANEKAESPKDMSKTGPGRPAPQTAPRVTQEPLFSLSDSFEPQAWTPKAARRG